MEVWKNLMTKGNKCFEQESWIAAEHYYQEAVILLDGLLQENPKRVDAVHAWICSYHNLSTLFQQTGRLALAQKCLLIPHQSMLYMAEHSSHDEEQRMIALQAIKITLNPLMAFANAHPTCDSCHDKLMSQYQAVHGEVSTYH